MAEAEGFEPSALGFGDTPVSFELEDDRFQPITKRSENRLTHLLRWPMNFTKPRAIAGPSDQRSHEIDQRSCNFLLAL